MRVKKDSNIIVKVTEDERNKFKEICHKNDLPMQKILRDFIIEYINKNK